MRRRLVVAVLVGVTALVPVAPAIGDSGVLGALADDGTVLHWSGGFSAGVSGLVAPGPEVRPHPAATPGRSTSPCPPAPGPDRRVDSWWRSSGR